MKNSKNRTTATAIALFLMLTITATLVALPIANAHTPAWTFPTSAYVTCAPSTIGIGQYTTIVMWVDRYSPTAGGGIGQRWSGYKIDITKPDGTKETLGPFQAVSDVGAHYVQYTPDQVGTYTIVFSWPGETAVAMPGQYSTSVNIGDYYAGSTSPPTTLIVQQEPTKEWQEPPLPTGYWTRPINDANRAWSQLASNWLKGSWLVNNWQRWGTAPESPHVLWTKPMTPARAGGINDAQWPGIPSNIEDYANPWSAPIIMNGKIYYNQPPVQDSARSGYYCIDLYTGEQIWYKNGTDNGLNNPVTMAAYTGAGGIAPPISQSYPSLTQGQLYHYHAVNGQGIVAYLWMVSGTTWYMLDAATGNWILTLKNVPAGTAVTDQDGSLLRYSYNAATGNVLCWNSSQAIYPGGVVGTGQQCWRPPLGAVIDAVNDTLFSYGPWAASLDSYTVASLATPHSGYTMNITVQKNLPGSITVLQDDNRVPKQLFGSYIRVAGSTIGSTVNADEFSAWLMRIDDHVTAYSPYPGLMSTSQNNLGFGATLLWNKNITVPLLGKNYTWSIASASYDDQVFILTCKQTSQLWGYSLTTGALLWGPTPTPQSQMSFYTLGSNMYYGKVLECISYGGTLAAFDAQTGKLLWNYNATSVGRESPYGDNQPLFISAVCDGKIYTYTSEHSPTKPLWRSSYVRCINATDGTEMWKLMNYAHFLTSYSIADGYLVTASDYDNLIYCIGKGPSATTVSAPQTVPSLGSSVMITGTVTDQSPGAKGTPAIADANMQAWMEYLYEQQAMPTNAKGVEVTLDAVDPNNNFIHIGTVTSDITGAFGYKFTPEVPGTYQIIATFAGSKSYGSSYAQTYMGVDEAPPAPAEPQPQPAPDNTAMFAGIIAAIVIVAILVAYNIVIVRKQRK